MAELSARAAAKVERAEQGRLVEGARELLRQIKSALRTPEGERCADAVALLGKHTEEAGRLQAAMAKNAARKATDAANMAEVEDDADVLREKVAALAELVRGAKHVVVYTGAGISTSANIPDYRGPQGIWTQMKLQPQKGSISSGSRAGSVDKLRVEPTQAHMALAALVRAGRVQQVISQNIDGLHLRSGIPGAALCELHGNVFRERCRECGRDHLRGFDVTESSAYHRHATERQCDVRACCATLHDTIVYFGEKVGEGELAVAQEHSRKADLAICMGTSLKVLQHYKYIWEQAPASERAGAKKMFAILNLQPTPKDRIAELVLRGRCDDVLLQLVACLGLEVRPYERQDDAVLKLACSTAHCTAHCATFATATGQLGTSDDATPSSPRQAAREAGAQQGQQATSGKPPGGSPQQEKPSEGKQGSAGGERSEGAAGAKAGSRKPSKAILCCRCGIMLDNEKGKTIRDGYGTCDDDDCEHWTCMPCSGAAPDYDGEWFCGCDACASTKTRRSQGAASSAAEDAAEEAPAAAVAPAAVAPATVAPAVVAPAAVALAAVAPVAMAPAAVAPAAVAPVAPPAKKAKTGPAPAGSSKPSKAILCCRCGIMLDNEKGKTIRDGYGTCDGDDCAHWTCMPCAGVDPDYEGEWFCGCDACTGCGDAAKRAEADLEVGDTAEAKPAEEAEKERIAAEEKETAREAAEAKTRDEEETARLVALEMDRKSAEKARRAFEELATKKAAKAGEAAAAADRSGSVGSSRSSVGTSRKPSKAIMCCRCGIKLDNDKGKTIRDGYGTCDGDDCEHWACMPCAGVDPDYDGEWFCGCDACDGSAKRAGAKPAEADCRVASGAGPSSSQAHEASDPSAAAAPVAPAPGAIAPAVKAPSSTALTSAPMAPPPKPPAAAKAPTPKAPASAEASSSDSPAPSSKPSKVVLCCQCGVKLDNEKGKTIRDGCGTCDGDGCDHWECIPCSGVEPGYDGEWFCGCAGCRPAGDAARKPSDKAERKAKAEARGESEAPAAKKARVWPARVGPAPTGRRARADISIELASELLEQVEGRRRKKHRCRNEPEEEGESAGDAAMEDVSVEEAQSDACAGGGSAMSGAASAPAAAPAPAEPKPEAPVATTPKVPARAMEAPTPAPKAAAPTVKAAASAVVKGAAPEVKEAEPALKAAALAPKAAAPAVVKAAAPAVEEAAPAPEDAALAKAAAPAGVEATAPVVKAPAPAKAAAPAVEAPALAPKAAAPAEKTAAPGKATAPAVVKSTALSEKTAAPAVKTPAPAPKATATATAPAPAPEAAVPAEKAAAPAVTAAAPAETASTSTAPTPAPKAAAPAVKAAAPAKVVAPVIKATPKAAAPVVKAPAVKASDAAVKAHTPAPKVAAPAVKATVPKAQTPKAPAASPKAPIPKASAPKSPTPTAAPCALAATSTAPAPFPTAPTRESLATAPRSTAPAPKAKPTAPAGKAAAPLPKPFAPAPTQPTPKPSAAKPPAPKPPTPKPPTPKPPAPAFKPPATKQPAPKPPALKPHTPKPKPATAKPPAPKPSAPKPLAPKPPTATPKQPAPKPSAPTPKPPNPKPKPPTPKPPPPAPKPPAPQPTAPAPAQSPTSSKPPPRAPAAAARPAKGTKKSSLSAPFLPPKKRLDGRLTPPGAAAVGLLAVANLALAAEQAASIPSPLLRDAESLMRLGHPLPLQRVPQGTSGQTGSSTEQRPPWAAQGAPRTL